MIGGLFRTIGPFAPAPPPGAQPPPLWGSEEHLRELLGDRVELETVERDVLEVTAFQRPADYAEHFKQRYGPTIAAQANARRNGKEQEFEAARPQIERVPFPEYNLNCCSWQRWQCFGSDLPDHPAGC